MKIRKPTPEMYSKISALLRQAFPGSPYEAQLVDNLRQNGKLPYDWVCIHTNRVIAYIAFTRAYNGAEICGLHLAPLAVKPDFQGQGIGAELLRFALRQEGIRDSTLFVLGNPGLYKKFGFTPCTTPHCPFDKKNRHFLSMRNQATVPYTVGYEGEFSQKG